MLPGVKTLDLVMCLSEASDMLNPLVVRHQWRVAFMTGSLAQALNYDSLDRYNLIIASALHDIGVFSLQERMETLAFDYCEGFVPHAEVGHRLLETFAPFRELSRLLRYHHVRWVDRLQQQELSEQEMRLANMIFLCDRLDVLLDFDREILGQIPEVLETLNRGRGSHFCPELLDALESLAQRESFWFELTSKSLRTLVPALAPPQRFDLTLKHFTELTRLFARIIDYRCDFTARHSSGVAAVAEQLGKAFSMSEKETILLGLAGNLHDIGKLAVPAEILSKSSRLDEREYAIVKRHAFHAHEIFRHVPPLSPLVDWISYHHEKPSGRGYPFRLKGKDIPTGARLLAVADVFTALSENRPYRSALEKKECSALLQDMARRQDLDAEMVDLLLQNYETYEELNRRIQEETARSFKEFCGTLPQCS